VLERGVADGIFFPWGSMFLFGLDKVTKYDMDVPLFTAVFTYSINKAKYDGMSAAQKKVIDDHLHQRVGGQGRLALRRLREGRPGQDAAAPGHEVYPLTPDQLKAWKAVSAPLQKQWAEAVTKAAAIRTRSYKELQDLIAKNGAGI
jgi:TRAP-type C4-dicarboxylate transport system substrate-binding protein